jgi:Na+/proline symporter
MQNSLIWIDYISIIGVLAISVGIALYFTKSGGESMESFFVSGRSLHWLAAGASLAATSFAADTPLWVTSLVREKGIQYVWQFWAPFVGSVLTVVYFGRRWRRMAFLTDIEFIETRYGGGCAKLLRGWSGAFGALIICPLICGWVIKAMETISTEALGLPDDKRIYATIGVVAVGIAVSVFGGLSGVVYADFFQLVLATLGTILLGVMAVIAVGGLDVLVERLGAMSSWPGKDLSMMPAQLPLWDMITFIVVGLGVATSGGYNAQRLLACRDSRHASGAQLLHTILYYALMPWPWIIVALCSMVLIPEIAKADAAYPKMMMMVLPSGLRGILIAAMLAAFLSTISTLFNWGASYLMNDIFRRFIKTDCSDRTYVVISRVATLLIATAGAAVALMADSIQQLLVISYVLGSGGFLINFMQWMWWRMNRFGAVAGFLAGWVVVIAMLLFKAFDRPMAWLLNLPDTVSYSSTQTVTKLGKVLTDTSNYDGMAFSTAESLTGARIALAIVLVTISSVVVALLTPPEPMENLKKFLLKARPFSFGWKPVIRALGEPYDAVEDFWRTMFSWLICLVSVFALIQGIGELLIGSRWIGCGLVALSGLTFWWTYRRLQQDYAHELKAYGRHP